MYPPQILLATLFASSVLATGIPGLPQCAGNCLTNYGGCSQFDVHCICANTKLIDGLACCVSKTCDAADQEATIKFANALCAGQGVTNLPQSATCAPGEAATATSGISATTSGSTSGSMTSSGTAASMTGSSTTMMSGSSTAKSTTSAAKTTSKQSTTSAAAPSSSSPAAAGNGATSNKIGMGMIMAGLLAAL